MIPVSCFDLMHIFFCYFVCLVSCSLFVRMHSKPSGSYIHALKAARFLFSHQNGIYPAHKIWLCAFQIHCNSNSSHILRLMSFNEPTNQPTDRTTSTNNNKNHTVNNMNQRISNIAMCVCKCENIQFDMHNIHNFRRKRWEWDWKCN